MNKNFALKVRKAFRSLESSCLVNLNDYDQRWCCDSVMQIILIWLILLLHFINSYSFVFLATDRSFTFTQVYLSYYYNDTKLFDGEGILLCLFNTNFEGEETVYLTVALSVNNEIMYYKGRLCDQLLHTCMGSQHSVICGKNTAEVMIIQVTLSLLESDCVTSWII